MSKPINRTKQKSRYRMLGWIGFFSILFIGLHLGKGGGEDTGVNVILATLEHLTSRPLDIFPIHWPTVGKAAIFSLLMPLLAHSEYLKHRDLRPSEENGSAHWNENLKRFYNTYAETTVKLPLGLGAVLTFLERLLCKVPLLGSLYDSFYKKLCRKFCGPDKKPCSLNMVFTKEIYMSMNTRKTRRNNNILVIGGSGSGKSRFFVKPNLLQANCSYVITDPSGELLETMGSYLEHMGYEVRVFNLVQMDHSFCYNPFNYIRDDNGVLTMITALIKNTTPEGKSSNDPFWEKAETALLQALCFFLQSECNPEDRNFTNVMKLLRCAEVREGQEDYDSTLDILFKDLKAKDPEHIAVRQYAVFKQAAGKTAQSILVSCSVRLTVFNMQSIANLTGTDSVDLATIGDRKVALFCITPTADTTFNFLIAMMYTQLFETLYHHAETGCKGKRLPVHVRFLLDEFANVGTIPDFPQKLSTMRKYEISCSIIIQALSQLKAMYKDDWEVLVGNCDSRLFLGGADETTLKYISNSLGKETIRAISNSRSWSKQSSYSQNFNKTGRELMTEYELSVMPNNNCVLFIRGEHPFFCTKYPLEKHPHYKKSGDANDKYLFDVAEQIFTGVNRCPIDEKDRYTQLYEECQQADSLDAEREMRLYMHPVEHMSARGRPLGQPQSLTEAAREYVKEHIPVPKENLSQQAVSEMVEKTFVQEKPLTSEEEQKEVLESTITSYVDYWALDENGFVAPAEGEEDNALPDTDSGEQEDVSYEDPDFSDMQD